MNRSNVMEIKKTLKRTENDISCIQTICTCFVNGNKDKLMCNTESINCLDFEEEVKYLDILKNALSGAIDKKLINLSFTSDNTSKTAQDQLYNTQQNIFTDTSIRDTFFDQIIANYDFGENYLIVVGKGVYDVPQKASDGAYLEDETDTYDFMITAICPVHSTKAGLTLDMESGRMISSTQVQIVEAPVHGFLYPAFNDRQSDVSSLLYFTKKPEDSHPEFIEALMGYPAPTLATEQQNIFENIIAEVTDDKAEFELVKELHDTLQQKVEEDQMNGKFTEYTKEDLKTLLSEAGVDDNKLQDFDHIYERAGGTDNTVFAPSNLMLLDKFNVKAPDIEIKIKPNRTDLVQKKKIDGKNCIVVTLEGDIELNGLQVSAI